MAVGQVVGRRRRATRPFSRLAMKRNRIFLIALAIALLILCILIGVYEVWFGEI
jgi:hypothetical protein